MTSLKASRTIMAQDPLKASRIMVPLDRAQALIDEMRESFYAALPVEEITIEAAVGRRLAGDASSRVSAPSYDLCTMDGYALRVADGYPLQIIGEAFAGRGFRRIGPGEAVYVTTGARLPEGADAILRVEDACVADDKLCGPAVMPGTFVVGEGADIKAGETLLRKGSVVTPAMAGILHTAGIQRLLVYRKPRVAVIATGDEIRDGTITDANGPMASALLEAWGCVPECMGSVGDNRQELSHVMIDALRGHDVVITIGGISMGKMDLVSSIVEDGLIFKGVRVSPGKPFIASCIDGKPVFSLPGKPSGSYTAMELLIKRFLLGAAKEHSVSVPLSRDVELQIPGFDYIVFVELREGQARPLGYEGSSVALFRGPEYRVSLLSASARTVLSDGYFIARDPVKAGQPVMVNLL